MSAIRIIIPLLFSLFLVGCIEISVNSGGGKTPSGGPACPPWVPWYVCNPGGGGGGARPPLGGEITAVHGTAPVQTIEVKDGLGGIWHLPVPPVGLKDFPAAGPVVGNNVELSFGGMGMITKK